MSKFKVGDIVRIIGSGTEAGKAKIGQIGEILDIDWKDGACFVLYPKGQDWVRKTDLVSVISAPADPKREFLQRLQALLKEFDAEIYFIFDPIGEEYGMVIRAKDFEIYRPGTIGLSVKNIMNFDKE